MPPVACRLLPVACCLFLFVPLALPACAPASATSPAGPRTASPSSSSAPVLPAEAPPLLIEYVVLRRAWVEHVLPVPPDAATSEAAEQAYRRAKAPELAAKLAADLTSRFRGEAPARAAIADAVLAVLGERAAEDAARPTAHLVLRANLDRIRLSPAAKAALTTFARSAHAGDALPTPAVDGDMLVVARARPAAGDDAPPVLQR